jgi:thermitase
MHRRVIAVVACLCLALGGLLAGAAGASAQADGSKVSLPPAGWYAPGRVIVRFADGASAAARSEAHAAVGGTVLKSFWFVPNLQVVQLASASPDATASALAAYRARPDVLYAEPDRIYKLDRTDVTPNDSLYNSMYNLNNTGQTGGTADADIDAPEAWNTTTGSANVYIGDIDTGIDWNHPDLLANTKPNPLECTGTAGVDDDGNGYVDDCHGIDPLNGDTNPMDDNGHGTHTGGTIGAVGNNSTGVTGINWTVNIIACKTHDPAGNGVESAVLECLQYMETEKAMGKNVVATNNSYGGCPEACGYSQAFYDAIASNLQKGILFVASAGNDAANNDTVVKYPTDYYLPNVISVAATDDDDLIASFSNFGLRTVAVGAPGVSVRSTIWDNAYAYLSGTSMAGPHVAGVTGLLAAQNPNRSWAQIKNLILAGGDNKGSMNGKTYTGKRLNANGALTCANKKLFSVIRPFQTQSGLSPITIAAINVKCAQPVKAALSVTISGGPTIQLLDNGLGADVAKKDGIFSGTWTPSPCSPGVKTLSFSNGKTASLTVTC